MPRHSACRADYVESGQLSDVEISRFSGTIPTMTNLTSVLNQLERERKRLAVQLEGLTHAISALRGDSATEAGRTISAAGRARIAAAQRARWAKAKGKKGASSARRKRTLSAAAIARIRAAQKERWAKWRKRQKAA